MTSLSSRVIANRQSFAINLYVEEKLQLIGSGGKNMLKFIAIAYSV
jgi:hypothetical protein